MNTNISTFLACSLLALAPVANTAANPNANWGQWRGPLGTGNAPDANPPSEWSEDKNIKWKVKVPGSGISTPIVWGDKIFLLTAVAPEKKADAVATPAAATASDTNAPAGQGGRRRGGGFGRGEKPTDKLKFTVLCLDRATGKTLWEKVATEEIPHEGHHQDHGFASASPVTDGEHVWAYFGSRGLHCYDMAGNKKWSKDFGDMITRASFGEGASPALYGDVLVINWDDEQDGDFIIALDKKTGKELWKKSRNEGTSWTTPLVLEHSGKKQVIVNAANKIRSYDLATGEEIWSCGGMGSNPVPVPVVNNDTIFVMSGHQRPALLAIALGRTGDLTDTDAIRWRYDRSTPYVPSPVLLGDQLYFLTRNDGKLSNFDVKTGKPNFEGETLTGIFGVYASLAATKDRIYVLSREGKCAVVKPGTKLEILATNKLEDRTDASMAMVGKELFIRGRESLYCIAEK